MPALGKETVKENSTEGFEQLDFFAVMTPSGVNRARVVLEAADFEGNIDPALILDRIQPAAVGVKPARVAGTPSVEVRLKDLLVPTIDGTPLEVKFRKISIVVDGDCGWAMMVLGSQPFKDA